MSVPAIRAALRTVADMRADHLAASAALRLKRAAFDEENRPLIEHAAALSVAVTEAEAAARALVLAHYAATNEKKPVAGAEVKLGTVYEYTAEDALAWAKQTNLCLIPESLDVKAFGKIAAVTTLPFVTSREEPRAQLATQLNAALLVEPAPAPVPEGALA